METQLDINKICRVCMISSQELLPIFDDTANNVGLAEILAECTKYKVERFDDLPQLICGLCVTEAQSAYSFKLNCEKSYRTLRDMLKSPVTPVLHRPRSIKIENGACAEKSTQTCTSNKQCHICICRRHTIDDDEPEEKMTMEAEDEIVHSEFLESSEALELQPNEIEAINVHQIRNCLPTEQKFLNYHSQSEDEDGISNTNEEPSAPMTSDDDDEKPLSNFVNPTTKKGFTEVLLNEESTADNIEDDNIYKKSVKREQTSSPQTHKSLQEDVLCQPVKRGRGRPRRKHKNLLRPTPSSGAASSCEDNVEYKCTDCDKVFQHRGTMQRHMLNHTEERKYPCRICAKRFVRSDFLKNHMNSVHDAQPVKCELCDKEFAHIAQYNRHKEAKHSERLHKCDMCTKSFTTKIFLQRHAASHDKKRYVCKECSQAYPTKDQLAAHIKAEGHDKPMLCPECGLRCKTSNILMVHMRRHNGEKPFKCKFCSKGFPRMDDLRVHEKYHTGEKSHFCETCGKGFQRKYNLTIHLRVHTGEKPYKCPHCPQAFAQGNDLKAHIRRHTGERFRCEVCGAAFLQGYQIRNHKFMEHGIKEDPPTQRVAKFTSPEEQEQQIKQNLQKDLSDEIVDSTTELGAIPEEQENQIKRNLQKSVTDEIVDPTTECWSGYEAPAPQ